MHERDEEGKLLPQEIDLELLKDKNNKCPKILGLPIPRGKLQRFTSELKNGKTAAEIDDVIIIEHCVKPKFTHENLKDFKLKYVNAITTALLSLSTGSSQEEDKETSDVISMEEQVLKKK